LTQKRKCRELDGENRESRDKPNVEEKRIFWKKGIEKFNAEKGRKAVDKRKEEMSVQ
jgi:hypothetical protein